MYVWRTNIVQLALEPADKNRIHLLNQRIIVMAPCSVYKCVCFCPLSCVCPLNKASNCAGSFRAPQWWQGGGLGSVCACVNETPFLFCLHANHIVYGNYGVLSVPRHELYN